MDREALNARKWGSLGNYSRSAISAVTAIGGVGGVLLLAFNETHLLLPCDKPKYSHKSDFHWTFVWVLPGSYKASFVQDQFFFYMPATFLVTAVISFPSWIQWASLPRHKRNFFHDLCGTELGFDPSQSAKSAEYPNPSIQPGRMWVWNCSCLFVKISQQFKTVTVQVGNRNEILEQHLIQQPLFRGLKTHWLEKSLIDPNLQPQHGDKNKCAFFF